jgi:hypothetical protein
MPIIMRILFLVFGLSGILGGVHIMHEGLLFYRGTTTSLGESRYFVGAVFLLLGIVSITIAVRKGDDRDERSKRKHRNKGTSVNE